MALRTLYQTLLDSDTARLRVIARLWEIPLLAERRSDLAAELADAMARADAVDRAWAALPHDQRAALEDLLRRGDALPWAVFSRRWGQIRAVGPGRLEREELWRAPVSPAEGLWYRGFLQRAYRDQGAGRVEVVFVPEELLLYLPEPGPLDVPPPESTSPPPHTLAGSDALADDLVTLWSFLQAEPVYLSPEGEWPESQRAAFMRRGAAPPRAIALLERLALERGWIHCDERGMLRTSVDPMLLWLQSGAWTQWSALARAWIDSLRWNDLSFVSTLDPDPAMGWQNDPESSRRAFLELMRQCAPGVWYPLAGFIAYVREQAPDFLRPEGDYEAWGLRDASTGASLRGFEAWESVEGALAGFFIGGPLFWLGMVDLGSVAPGSAHSAFRVNAAGAALLHGAEPPPFPEPRSLTLSSSGLIGVPARRRYERFQVSRVALSYDRAGELYRYRLTPDSLHRARQQRIPPERIADFLEEMTERTVPEGLRAAILRAYQEEAAAHLERGWILRVRDPEVLELPALRRFVREILGPKAALIRSEDRDHVLSLLTREGILPEIEA